jgi:hypothetical protein
MDVSSIISAQMHARTAKVQLAVASMISGSPGTEQAVSKLTRAAIAEQDGLARAAQAIASPQGGIDIRV